MTDGFARWFVQDDLEFVKRIGKGTVRTVAGGSRALYFSSS